MQYPINEIFYSLQGEANFAGLPAIFIRLQGCAVGCSFCDTKHTWELNPKLQTSSQQILAKTGDAGGFAYFSNEEILGSVQTYPSCRHVVFTGGEPAQYNLLPLINELEELGYTVQIETSGTEILRVSPNTWVTLSPKIAMADGKSLLPENLLRANEIKMPVGKPRDIENLQQLLANYPINTRLIWLQPLSCKTNPTRLCVDAALKNNWRVSLQIHKYLEIR